MHAFAIVLVKPGDDVASEVERLMAPFGEGSEAYEAQFDAEGNELAGYVPGAFWWDWYRIGGRQDGKICSLRYETAPGCACHVDRDGNAFSIVSRKPGDSDCHYSDRHEQLERNVASVPDLRELQCFTLVTPEGEFRHRWVPGTAEDDPGFDRWCGEQLLAHRDCLAVGIDYHD